MAPSTTATHPGHSHGASGARNSRSALPVHVLGVLPRSEEVETVLGQPILAGNWV